MYLLKEAPEGPATPAQDMIARVSELMSADSERVMVARFHRLAEGAGFTSVACLTLPAAGGLTPECIHLNTRPVAWSEEYAERDYACSDPIIRAFEHTDQAIAWSDVTAHRTLDEAEREVMRHAGDFGMQEGFVVPIFEASGQLGLVSLAGPRVDLDPTARGLLTLASLYLHSKLSAPRRRGRTRAGTSLTARELEVMKWIAAGKSDWQIGQILSLSAKTVNYHVENVKRKYGVASRIQAVVAALTEGQLPQ